MNAIPITVIIPVKNEAVNLPYCLKELGQFDEVIVVDSGSTDKTTCIAEQFGARVIDFKWNGTFPKKRNWTLRNVSIRNDWVLFLDADEFIDDKFAQEVERAVQSREYCGYYITYQNWFSDTYLRFGYPLKKVALFRKDAGEYEKIDESNWSGFDMEIHEHPILSGKIGTIKTAVKHKDFKGMHSYIAKHNEYSTWEAHRFLSVKDNWHNLRTHQKIKYSLLNSWILAPLFFFYAYIIKGGIFDGKAGLKLAILKMIYFSQIKIKISEIRRSKNEQS